MNDSRVKIIKIDRYYSAILLSGKISEMLKSYDILYVKGTYPYVFPAVKSGKPTVLVVHQLDSAKLFKGIVPKLKVVAANLMTGYTIRRPDTVVTVSDELATFYNKKYGIKAQVIEDQISDAFFNAQMRTRPNKRQTLSLLTVGNWDGPNGRKRQDILLRHFADSVKVRSELRLRLVGLSKENLNDLGKLSEKMHLNGYVQLRGFLDENELVKEYLSSHVYVTATTYEGFYRQIVEAFATGMPAVAYDSRDTVDDLSKSAATNHVIKSGAGKLFRDSESFLNSIVEVINNYDEYSARAGKYALRYSSKVIGSKTENLLESFKYR